MRGLSQVETYFSEGRSLWTTNPEMVSSRQFFELWEASEKPRPFRVESDVLNLCGYSLELTGESTDRVGYFCWETSEECAVLKVETSTCVDSFLLTFDDGNPHIYDGDTEYLDVEELEYGESLEVIYDVIATAVREHPESDVFNLSSGEYRSVLDSLKNNHDRRTVNAMRQISPRILMTMIREAALDMGIDGAMADEGDLLVDERKQRLLFRIIRNAVEKRTPWSVLLDVQMLVKSAQLCYQNEQEFVLELKSAERVKSTRQGIVIRIPVKSSTPVREGDQLTIYKRGDRQSLGTLRIELHDGNCVYGRIKADGDVLASGYYAQPRKSPREFMWRAMEALMTMVEKDDKGLGSAVKASLGLSSASLTSSVEGTEPDHLNVSQKRAWNAAVNAANRIVLIQGPPGTGKTSVLDQVLRALVTDGKRVLVTAPSNTAVDNICRKVLDLPLLRLGGNKDSIAPDISAKCWIGDTAAVDLFAGRRRRTSGGGIYAGTHVGIIRNKLVQQDCDLNGNFDVIIFDEAGMASMDEFLLCSQLSNRAILFGDQKQLPPFPLPDEVVESLDTNYGPYSDSQWSIVQKSALEWLISCRQFPVLMLDQSYRCQNPRLLRFASTLFYDARVKTSATAEFYQLSAEDREVSFPSTSLRMLSTSSLPNKVKSEELILEGNKPGIMNKTEANLCCETLYELLRKYPLKEITVIAPYRRQVAEIRKTLSRERIEAYFERKIQESAWKTFLATRISTVDSFQGGESDAVIICYVRSNQKSGIGFVDDPNRVNVAHTRARREMIVIGDIDCLKRQARSSIFTRMERACERDGTLVRITENDVM